MLLANSDHISRCPTQLYYSVLPFLPSDTYLARKYPAPRGSISVVTGRESSWPPSLFTLPYGGVAAFSPGGRMFAVGREDGIHIYDASNGLLNSSIRSMGSTDHSPFFAAFTEDGCGVVVVSRDWKSSQRVSYRIETFDLVQQSGQICQTTPDDDDYPLKLSEYGSYVAFARRDARICIWKTDGGDDLSIPLGCVGKVSDLDLTGESAHMVAVAMKDILVLSIPSGCLQRTLYHEDVEYVHISRDGLFLASQGPDEIRLWSITQGTLLAKFSGYDAVFSRTNRLYVAESGGLKVYDASADLNNVTIKSFPLPIVFSILPTPDESRILIRTISDIQVWQVRDTRDAPRYDIMDMDLSNDVSLLALATETDIEIWDARIGQRLHVIQSRNGKWNFASRPVAFSPKGELIVSNSDGGIIVVDVRTGVLLPTTYSRGRNLIEMEIKCVGISFDSSKLAAYGRWCQLTGEWRKSICVWDLPTGTLLHSLQCDYIDVIQWLWTDQYLLFKDWTGILRYLNAETFQEEVLEHPGDRFQGPNHLYLEGNELKIRLSNGREGLLFSALPSDLDVDIFSLRRDRACIFSWDKRLLLLNTSGLEAYMEICDLQFDPEVSRIKLCRFFL